MDNVGRTRVQMQGTSQQGSTKVVLQPSLSSPLRYPSLDLKQAADSRQLKKSFTAPSASMSSPIRQNYDTRLYSLKKTVQVPDFLSQELSQRLSLLEAEGSIRRFTSQELNHITNNFSPEMLIGEGRNSEVYRGNLQDGQIAAVKVLKIAHWSEEDVFREVELLSSMKHENIVHIIGCCHSKEVNAVVYNLLGGSLKQYLKQLKWNERMVVAIGVAKALEYLHHCCDPPIIHRDVKSSNILLSDSCQPQVSSALINFIQNAH